VPCGAGHEDSDDEFMLRTLRQARDPAHWQARTVTTVTGTIQ
jgi:hypothetical protein